MLGPQCNHDLGILLRICDIAEGHASIDKQEHERVRSALLEAIGDHEYYCSSYSSKEQPHIDGLLITLADSVRHKEQDMAQAAAEGQIIEGHEKARKLLHRLMSATNRRMHKGFPEMLSYLLRRPMEYSSHKFVPLFFDMDYRKLLKEVYKQVGQDQPSGSTKSKSKDMSSAEKHGHEDVHVPKVAFLQQEDYEFRPVQLEDCPRYFFFAACEAKRQPGPETLHWAVVQDTSGEPLTLHARNKLKESSLFFCQHRVC